MAQARCTAPMRPPRQPPRSVPASCGAGDAGRYAARTARSEGRGERRRAGARLTMRSTRGLAPPGGDWCIGNTVVSKTATRGSTPRSPALARPRRRSLLQRVLARGAPTSRDARDGAGGGLVAVGEDAEAVPRRARPGVRDEFVAGLG